MCSIPGLPTPGSEVPVLIKRVNLNPDCGLVELLVNMGDERKHIYAQMRDEIQNPQRKFNGFEGKPADLCLVCVSDTWHRARIVSCQNQTYNVCLIDSGQPHTTTCEALAWGHIDSFLLPPETESCILANVLSHEKEKATKFLKSLQGKKIQGLVQTVLSDGIILLDIPTVSKHMYKLGMAKKVKVDEFKCLVQERLHLPKGFTSEGNLKIQQQNLKTGSNLEKHNRYFYPELLTETFETVNVTEVHNPNIIFCKIQIFSKAIKTASEQIHQHYEESSDLGEDEPKACGDPCATKGKNGRWHRSLLKQNIVSDGVVEVLHVDDGKTEFIPVGDIKPLHSKFLRMPVFTYPCSLDGAKHNGAGWTTEQTNYLKSLLLDQILVARFNPHNIPLEVYNVTLFASEATCINSCFMEKAGLFPPFQAQQDSNVQNKTIPSSFLSFLGGEQCEDLGKVINVGNSQVKSLGMTQNQALNGKGDDIDTARLDEVDKKVHSPTAFSAVEQNDHEDVFTVGKGINVKVSCIESLQKFWCQTTEYGESLRLLMQDLQIHYASIHPQPIVETICVARNPDNKLWCRAKIIASRHSPVVDVRFVDYGHTREVPLQDVRPIDPAFLRLNAQAFQCSLFNPKNTSNPMTDAALAEFQRFVDLGASSNTGLKCIVKAVTFDEEGVPLNVVDIKTPSNSASKLLTQKCAEAESVPSPLELQSDGYRYSMHSIEVGTTEKVSVTFSENVNHFYCQLERNLLLFDKVMKNVNQLIGKPQCKRLPLGLNSICFARYTNNEWSRGQIVETSPKLKVHFVDYGDTLAVNEPDICPFTPEVRFARSVPVQAVQLGLHNVPSEVPQEVNQWFADHIVGCSFTISVVAKEEKGKLIVQLFDGSLNVNKEVTERTTKMSQQKMTGLAQQTTKQPSNCSENGVPNEGCLIKNLEHQSGLPKVTEENDNKVNYAREEQDMSSQSIVNVSVAQVEHELTLGDEKIPNLEVILEAKETVLAETFIQNGHSDLVLPSCPEEHVKTCMYKRPNVSLNTTEEAYASCIAGPNYFWCQYTNTEELEMMSRLAQEVGKMQQNVTFPFPLEAGSPCLALYSMDNQWYRARVIQKTDNLVHVLFIDYGNESEVDILNVRPLPQSLLEKAPQAFLCSLKGFDETKGSWDDSVYDDFHNILVDKPLKVTVCKMEDHSEHADPQYAVQVESESMLLNEAMQKYWKTTATELDFTENLDVENLLQGSQTESNTTNIISVRKENMKMCTYKKPNIPKDKKVDFYASLIVDPHYFWCQSAQTEELNKISMLVQEAGQIQLDMMSLETLGPGSPCLALFSRDKQWYRAQVLCRIDNAFKVLFIDYGNDSNVENKNLRPLPQCLLDEAPQAFLCSLTGFDVSNGSWDEEVYDEFSNLLDDKPLKLTVFNMDNNSEIPVPQYRVEIECEGLLVNAAMQKYWKTVAKEGPSVKSLQTETALQDSQTVPDTTHLSVFKEHTNTCMYKEPKVYKNKSEMVYASCIAEPHYFWCQYANTEVLNKVTKLAQKAGHQQQDMMFSENIGPGTPCLALYSSDEQWYRAQVISRDDDAFHVVFIDYGNESAIGIKNVRPLPQCLLDELPQAFLCSLTGFDLSSGSWDDEVYDEFYNLLVDKPLRVTVIDMDNHSELAVPQHKVEIECNGVVVNKLMEKYWKGLDTNHTLGDALPPVVGDQQD